MPHVATFLLVLLSFVGRVQQSSPNLIFYENFEEYNFAEEGEAAPHFSLQKLGQSITSEIQACEGETSVRFHVDSRLSGYEDRRRSMLMMKPHPDNHGNLGTVGAFDTTAGEEFWYGFAIYVPSKWNTSALVWQQKAGLHYAFYDGDQGVRTGMNPTISLRIDDSDARLRWKYLVKSDPQMIDGPNNEVPSTQQFMGTVKKDDWNTFVIHAKYTHRNNGQLEFWVNGNKYDYAGRTVVAHEGFRDAQRRAADITYDYADPHNFSFGIYKPELGNNPTGKQYTLYFDAFRIGDQNSSYEEVSPQCEFEWTNQIFLPIINH